MSTENQSAQAHDCNTRQGISDAILGKTSWENEYKGFCRCPGVTQHTTGTGKRDTIIYTDGVPTVFCMHQGCAEEVETANRELRRAIREGDTDLAPLDEKERRKQEAATQSRERMERRARSGFGPILQKFSWKMDDVAADSKVDLSKVALKDHGKLLLRLFKPDDTVWLGNRTDSGSDAKAKHFRTAAEWINGTTPDTELVCPATFKPGSVSRSNEQVEDRRFLVVESDVLAKDDVCAVFRWLRDAVELRLDAIVDTGGKSLHGWFEFPSKNHLEELEIILPALGCDPGMFRASQPARMPGVIRANTGREQRLLFVSKEVSL